MKCNLKTSELVYVVGGTNTCMCIKANSMREVLEEGQDNRVLCRQICCDLRHDFFGWRWENEVHLGTGGIC